MAYNDSIMGIQHGSPLLNIPAETSKNPKKSHTHLPDAAGADAIQRLDLRDPIKCF
jgi:hypothetical protein